MFKENNKVKDNILNILSDNNKNKRVFYENMIKVISKLPNNQTSQRSIISNIKSRNFNSSIVSNSRSVSHKHTMQSLVSYNKINDPKNQLTETNKNFLKNSRFSASLLSKGTLNNSMISKYSSFPKIQLNNLDIIKKIRAKTRVNSECFPDQVSKSDISELITHSNITKYHIKPKYKKIKEAKPFKSPSVGLKIIEKA